MGVGEYGEITPGDFTEGDFPSYGFSGRGVCNDRSNTWHSYWGLRDLKSRLHSTSQHKVRTLFFTALFTVTRAPLGLSQCEHGSPASNTVCQTWENTGTSGENTQPWNFYS